MGTNYYFDSTNGFVAILDIHFGKKCNIRLDNTEDVIEKKLNEVLEYCLNNDVKVVILAGDVFENCSIDRKTFMRAYSIFNEFKKNGVYVFTIYGNHDEYRYNPKYRKETPLNDLKDLEVITIINSEDSIEIVDYNYITYNIYGFPYTETDKLKEFSINKEYNDEERNVIIGHTFFENEFMGGDNNLTKEHIKKIGADYYILGHDHSYYEPEEVSNSYVFRFGSLVRGTSSKNDLEREVMVMHFCDNEWEEIKLNAPKLENVVIAKASIKEQKIDYKEMIEEIKITDDDNNDSVIEAINKIENEKVKEVIRRNI